MHSFNLDFHLKGLSKVYTSEELQSIRESQSCAIEILSYFATSLYDKNSVSEVAWDITKNCLAHLGLEDCIIYTYHPKNKVLLQQAAYGDKDGGNRKILSPLQIPLGKGIVGHVAKTGKLLMVNNLEHDNRYIIDDKKRKSELAVPILHENTMFGVLDSENSKKGFFNDSHVLLFRLIAKLTATKLSQIKKDKTVAITDDNVYYKRFVHLLETERVFLDPDISLQKCSGQLNISAGYLSLIINTLGGGNFSEFINKYRITEAKRLLTNLQFSNYTIATIGYQVGFNSKSAFYTAFNKFTGKTPAEYRNGC